MPKFNKVRSNINVTYQRKFYISIGQHTLSRLNLRSLKDMAPNEQENYTIAKNFSLLYHIQGEMSAFATASLLVGTFRAKLEHLELLLLTNIIRAKLLRGNSLQIVK